MASSVELGNEPILIDESPLNEKQAVAVEVLDLPAIAPLYAESSTTPPIPAERVEPIFQLEEHPIDEIRKLRVSATCSILYALAKTVN
jgi:hypothetical protein